ncbi:methyltransferase LaeA-like, putative [Trichophyton benhamiae CBS 112371]|uniref:Methyltransferase LaeA-like, putative n=1 Tax=Arthroderma benhamiae (strain ATCC MYA-4681 / CBS 112371) TaxID=663331 RepID=D4AIU9_ARTBC|nr:methyltransferase LaeA-like, putative [Trichophyton benhamiae CBS 112371]EFE36672.1 methyltransferase LaeA-like, putative [Trichophyton benhamiae CBS 112371]
MPRNCTFEIDDFEEEWQYPESYHFSYIHARNLVGSISDYDKFFAQAYENLLPGGYLEVQSTEANFFSDDGTRERAVTANLWQKLLVKGYRKFGKPLNVEQTWAEKMRAAGFVDVVEEVIKVGMMQLVIHKAGVVQVELIFLCIGACGTMVTRPKDERDRSLSSNEYSGVAGVWLNGSIYPGPWLDHGRA